MALAVSLSPAEQLIVRDASPRVAGALVVALRGLYGPVRGLDDAGDPRVLLADAIDLVLAFDRLAAPLAPSIQCSRPALWLAWEHARARVFAHANAAPDLFVPVERPAVLWRALLEPFARELVALTDHRAITNAP